jgi:gamma-glutamyltranspeptidase/glutathione hydrolase
MRCLLLLPILTAMVFGRQPVRARQGMVVTQEPIATDVGVEILKQGGNAVDAAVAVGFALAATYPFAGNIGGGGFMLIRLADGRTSFMDFREKAPASASRDMYLDAVGNPTKESIEGWRSSGVPGTVRGLALAHQKYGKLGWDALVQPAVDLAQNGFPVSYALAESLKAKHTLADDPNSKRIYLNDGAGFQAGDIFKQPELATTLGRIKTNGAKDFYEGETAQLLASAMAQHGGLVTLADLKNYQAVERQPLSGSYRNYTVISAPPPSSGGIGTLQMLGMLEGSGYEKSGAGSAASIHYVAEVMRRQGARFETARSRLHPRASSHHRSPCYIQRGAQARSSVRGKLGDDSFFDCG